MAETTCSSRSVSISSIIDRVSNDYGYTELKQEQRRILSSFLQGSDVFGCLPTGFGKSVCFMLLPKAFDVLRGEPDGTNIIIVVAPLTSLIEDQVSSCISRGINAVAVTKQESRTHLVKAAIKGDFQIVYISPEMLIATTKWRNALQNEVYQSRLRAVIIDEAHCVKKWGDEFRETFRQIGELRSIAPSSVNIMALTATATNKLRKEVCTILGMPDPCVIELSPDKTNVFLACYEFTSIVETFGPIADKLKAERVNMGRIIIFCKKRDTCNQIYSFFLYCLRNEFTEPPNESIAVPEYRLVDKFTSGTQLEVKEKIIKSFKCPTAPLRIVVATIAFGLGIDCPNVRYIIHVGPPDDIESYVQHIGRSGRDSKPSCAIMLHGSTLMRNSSKDLAKYCQLTDLCRRNVLFADFACYVPGSVIGCKCCDICAKSCTCGSCKEYLSNFIMFQ